MKKLDFKTFQKKITPELYSFAFVMVPDDLQASQIVIDANLGVAYSANGRLASLHDDELESENHRKELQLYRLELYRGVFQISRRRLTQLKGGIPLEGPFYKLNFVTRAAIFLKHKTDFSIQEIAEILSISQVDLTKEIVGGHEALSYTPST